jgi:hypothetical protein
MSEDAFRTVRISPLLPISEADLSDPWAEVQASVREQALAVHWQVLVDLTGSEEFAATVVELTPGLGVPRQAAEILKARYSDGDRRDG